MRPPMSNATTTKGAKEKKYLDVGGDGRHDPFTVIKQLVMLMGPVLPIVLTTVIVKITNRFYTAFVAVLNNFNVLHTLKLTDPIEAINATFTYVLIFTLLHNILHCTRRTSGRCVTFGLLTLVHSGIFNTLHHLAPTGLRNHSHNSLVSLVATSVRTLRIFCTRAVSPVYVTFVYIVNVANFIND